MQHNVAEPREHYVNIKKLVTISSHLIKLSVWEWVVLTKGVHGNPQITQVIARTIDCCPQTVSETSLLKTTLTELFEHEDVELVPT